MPKNPFIYLRDGSKAESIIEFDDGNSHIIEDDEANFVVSSRLFPEALKILRRLPIPKALFTKAIEDSFAEETTRRITEKLKP